MSTDTARSEVLDVAIVGGGVSGIYSGWRLLTCPCRDATPPRKVALFEASRRIGGRLLSVTPPGIPNTRVELGGMRYTSQHIWVRSLLQHLGISSVPFPVGEPQNIFYLRGYRLRRQDLTNPALIPYNLFPDEQTDAALEEGFTAVAAARVVRSVLCRDVSLSDVDWKELARTGTYEGLRLRDLPIRYLLQRNVSEEALRFADDASGYNSILYTWNAADGLPWNLGDFGKTVSYFKVTGGFDTLPQTMAQRFEEAGGELKLGFRLKNFNDCTADDGSKLIAMQLDQDDGSTHTIMARNLILAMPRRSLELLDQSGAVLERTPENRHVHELIRSVTPIPLFKLAVCYRFPWWETIDPVLVNGNGGLQWMKISKGQSITDLPVRQCYYWAVDDKTRNAVALIYDDGRDLDYWAGLRERGAGELYQNPEDKAGSEPVPIEWKLYQAPKLMVLEVHRQLVEMHGVQNRVDIPKPYAAAYRDWSEDPYGGGANFWHLHVDSEQVSRDILQPKPPVRVFVCGEAYSHHQGWVEGALRTADRLLSEHFGLGMPSWIIEPV